MRELVLVAMLAVTPAQAAACRKFKIWHYPWPQCSGHAIPHIVLKPTPAPAAPAAAPAALKPSLEVFTKHWSDAAADAAQRNLTPSCSNDHCSLTWIAKDGSTITLTSYTNGKRIVCTDWGFSTIDCFQSDGTEQKVEVR